MLRANIQYREIQPQNIHARECKRLVVEHLIKSIPYSKTEVAVCTVEL